MRTFSRDVVMMTSIYNKRPTWASAVCAGLVETAELKTAL
jgi:hypothetical protein